MDPDQALKDLRYLINRTRKVIDRGDRPDNYEITEIFELFTNLDRWLLQQGFLPSSWERK